MAMTVDIVLATGAGPAFASLTAAKWNRVDTAAGTTVIPTPTSTGTNFSYIKSFLVDITATGGLTMTDITFGKVAAEATTGTKLWYADDHNEAAYTQATTPPGATGDDNSTAPDINSSSVEVAVPLISSGDLYDAGPFSSVARVGNIIEVCLGVDSTNTTAGSTVATPTLRWEWTEA